MELYEHLIFPSQVTREIYIAKSLRLDFSALFPRLFECIKMKGNVFRDVV